MLEVKIKEVYKEEVKPTETWSLEFDDTPETSEVINSRLSQKVSELVTRAISREDKLQAFYISVNEK